MFNRGKKRKIVDLFQFIWQYIIQVLKRVSSIEAYREENDWLVHFLEDCCDIGASLEEASGALYMEYRNYGNRYGEHVRSTADFYRALEAAGFVRHKRGGRKYISGLQLKTGCTTE